MITFSQMIKVNVFACYAMQVFQWTKSVMLKDTSKTSHPKIDQEFSVSSDLRKANVKQLKTQLVRQQSNFTKTTAKNKSATLVSF